MILPNNLISITPSGFFGSDKKNIKVIENFIEKNELDIILDFARNIKVWDKTDTKHNENDTIIYESIYWENRVCGFFNIAQQNFKVLNLIGKKIDNIKPEIEKTFNVKLEHTDPCIVKWLPGQFQKPHADKELHEGPDAGKPNNFPHYDIATVFYLNDNYDGGEIYFPNQGVEFKPKAGSAYSFPGDKEYVHGVKEIKNGERFTIPLFWTIISHNS